MPETVTGADAQDLPEEEVVAQSVATEEVESKSEDTAPEAVEAADGEAEVSGDEAAEADAETEESGSPSRLIFSERRFDEFPIGDLLKESLAEMKYEHPTDVQEEVIEAALKGKDLVVQAKNFLKQRHLVGVVYEGRQVFREACATETFLAIWTWNAPVGTTDARFSSNSASNDSRVDT